MKRVSTAVHILWRTLTIIFDVAFLAWVMYAIGANLLGRSIFALQLDLLIVLAVLQFQPKRWFMVYRSASFEAIRAIMIIVLIGHKQLFATPLALLDVLFILSVLF